MRCHSCFASGILVKKRRRSSARYLALNLYQAKILGALSPICFFLNVLSERFSSFLTPILLARYHQRMVGDAVCQVCGRSSSLSKATASVCTASILFDGSLSFILPLCIYIYLANTETRGKMFRRFIVSVADSLTLLI